MTTYPPGRWLNPADRPDGCRIIAAGRWALPAEGARFERHFHDDDELWFIATGKARISVAGVESYVQAGDIVLTSAGDLHDVVELYEPLTGFFTETGQPEPGRIGHLYAAPADEAGHEVPLLPLPADFPLRD